MRPCSWESRPCASSLCGCNCSLLLFVMDDRKHSCYILFNENHRTYIGYTVNLARRIRQHNGELSGGARATSGKGPWRYLCYITSPTLDANTALSLEWWLKHPLGRRSEKEFRKLEGKLLGIPVVLSNPKFSDHMFCIYACSDFMQELKSMCEGLENVHVELIKHDGLLSS